MGRPSMMRSGMMRSGMMRSGMMRSGMMGSAMTQPPPETGPEPQSNDRNSVLIERYHGILDRQPTEGFALQRLLELYRERDGGVDALITRLRENAESAAAAVAPRLLLGHVLRAQGDNAGARREYEAAASLSETDPLPEVSLARLIRAEDPASARTHFETALARTTGDEERRELLRELGALALEARDVDGARRYYDDLVRGAGTSIYLRTEFARALVERGMHEAGVEEYQRVLRSMRGDNRVLAPILRELAQAQLDAGDSDAALESVQRALRLSARGSGIRREIYEVLVEAHRRTERLPELVASLEDARDFDSVELRARLRDELGQEEEALSDYRAALRTNRRHIDTRVRIIQLLSRSGRLEEVVQEYRELIRVAPREPRFVVELAQLLMETGQREEALRVADQISRRSGRDPSVHAALAELYTRWGENERATREMQALVRVDPRDPGHIVALGEQFAQDGNDELAVQTWRRILTVETDRARANFTVGSVMVDHAMLEQAEPYLRRAVELEPREIEYLRALAGLYDRPRTGENASQALARNEIARDGWMRVLHESEEAAERREARRRIVAINVRTHTLPTWLQTWTRAFNANPPDIEAGTFLAEAYLRARPRDLVRADQTLTRIVELQPGAVESLVELERVKRARGDFAGAIAVLERLVEADARHAPRYLQQMAEHAHALYRDEDAIRYAAMAVSRAPDDADAHRRLAELYRERQDLEQSVASYRRALELNDRLMSAYFELAEVHLALGQPREASELYRGVIRVSPDDDLVSRAGRAALQIHLGDGSLEVLEQELLPLALRSTRRPIFRRLLVELYGPLVSGWIRAAQGDGVRAAEAQENLRGLGTRALKPLLEALADSDPAQNEVAVGLLGYLENPNAAGPLLAIAEDESRGMGLRRRALDGAVRVANENHLERLREMAEGPVHAVRGLAAWGIARIGNMDAARAARPLLESGDPVVRAYAAVTIGRAQDGGAAEALVRGLRTDVSHAAVASGWALLELHRQGLLRSRTRSSLIDALRELEGQRAWALPLSLLAQARLAPSEEVDRALATQFLRTAGLNTLAAAILNVPEGELEPLAPFQVDLIALSRELFVGGGAPDMDRWQAPLSAAVNAALPNAQLAEGAADRLRNQFPLLRANEASWTAPERTRFEEAIQEIRRNAQPALRTALEALPAGRHGALLELVELDSDAAVYILSQQGTDAARRLLARMREEPSHRLEAVVPHLNSPSWRTRRDAYLVFEARCPCANEMERAQTQAETALREDDFAFVREAAARFLQRHAPDSAALRRAAELDEEPSVRAAASGRPQ